MQANQHQDITVLLPQTSVQTMKTVLDIFYGAEPTVNEDSVEAIKDLLKMLEFDLFQINLHIYQKNENLNNDLNTEYCVSESQVACPFSACHRRYFRSREFWLHMVKHFQASLLQNVSITDHEEISFKCPSCSFVTENKRTIIQHYGIRHGHIKTIVFENYPSLKNHKFLDHDNDGKFPIK